MFMHTRTHTFIYLHTHKYIYTVKAVRNKAEY